jgi:hypothetical protein
MKLELIADSRRAFIGPTNFGWYDVTDRVGWRHRTDALRRRAASHADGGDDFRTACIDIERGDFDRDRFWENRTVEHRPVGTSLIAVWTGDDAGAIWYRSDYETAYGGFFRWLRSFVGNRPRWMEETERADEPSPVHYAITEAALHRLAEPEIVRVRLANNLAPFARAVGLYDGPIHIDLASSWEMFVQRLDFELYDILSYYGEFELLITEFDGDPLYYDFTDWIHHISATTTHDMLPYRRAAMDGIASIVQALFDKLDWLRMRADPQQLLAASPDEDAPSA